MPGNKGDYDNLLQGIDSGAVTLEQVKINASRVVRTVRALTQEQKPLPDWMFAWQRFFNKYLGNTAQFPPYGLSTASAAAARHLRCQNAR